MDLHRRLPGRVSPERLWDVLSAATDTTHVHGVEVLTLLRLAARKVIPSRRFMRAWFAPAGAGRRGGMVLGYLYRPAWLLLKARPAGARGGRHGRRGKPGSRRPAAPQQLTVKQVHVLQ